MRGRVGFPSVGKTAAGVGRRSLCPQEGHGGSRTLESRPPLSTSEGLRPRPPGTRDWPRAPPGTQPAGSTRRFPERTRRALDAGEGDECPPAGRVGRPGRPWRAARTLAPFPAGGPAAFRMGGGKVVAGRRMGGGEGGQKRGVGGVKRRVSERQWVLWGGRRGECKRE